MLERAVSNYLKRQNKYCISIKAILFDMDGVLFDSMKYHARAWHECAVKRNLVSTYEDFYIYEGCTSSYTVNELYKRTFNRPATEDEVKNMYKEKSELLTKYNKGEIVEGILDVLQQVKEYDLSRLVVTGSGQPSLIDKIEKTFPGHFKREKMVTAFDVKNGKPAPEPYLIGLQKAGVEANEAFVIENAPMGVQAGHAAGIFTIAVNTGPLRDEVLIDSGADLLYSNMHALAEDWPHLIQITQQLRNESALSASI